MNNDSVLLSLQRATHVTLHRLTSELADLDLLSPSEINALGNLSDGPARTVSELGAAVGSKSTTLTGILDRLERRDLITRSAHPTDRRAVLVELTEDGRAAATMVASAITEIERQALAGIDPAALTGFHTVIAALVASARP